MIELPCKIGDKVYIIRNHRGIYHVHSGFVTQMYFLPNMELNVTVGNIGRGRVGEKVFLTYDDAERKVREKNYNAVKS